MPKSVPKESKAAKVPLGKAFANLFSASVASNFADGIVFTAIPLLAVHVTKDALLISGIAALVMLPWLLFAIPAGIIVDRVDRRLALSIAETVRTCLGLVLLVLTASGNLTIWWLYLITFLYGTCETVYDNAARAVPPSILSKAQLPKANSLLTIAEQTIQNFVAGPFTSLLFAVSALIPLGVSGTAYLAAAILALFLPRVASGRQFARAHEAKSGNAQAAWYKQFVDGYRFIMSDRRLRTLWFFSSFGGLCTAIATSSFVLYIVERLKLPVPLFGVFLLTGAIGGIAAAFLAPKFKERFGTGLSMAVSNLLTGIFMTLTGVFPNLWAVGAFWIVVSAAIVIWNILVMSFRQAAIPGRLLGRVHGTWRTLLWGCLPLGSLIGGFLGRIDLTLPYIVGGGLATIAGVIWFGFVKSIPNPEDIDNGDADAEASSQIDQDPQDDLGGVAPVVSE
ncbi:MAG: MFS transporter [Microbacteriaceae bacterium]|nr:MFS transporter [Microbacteriaceae bacterium]